MADTTTWTAITGADNPVEVLGPTCNFTAGAAIKRNMVVAFAATGVSGTVHPAVSGTTGAVVGVALTDAAIGKKVAVALDGSVVTVREGAGSTIDAGDYVAADDAAATGCVKGIDTTATNYDVIGIAIDDFSANGLGRIIVRPQAVTKAAS
jgi:hypothetical protein